VLAKTTSIVLGGFFALAGLQAASAASISPWQSPHHTSHQLVGKIWSLKDGKFVSRRFLRQTARTARFLLLGEIHTNKDHHRLQAEFLDLASKGKHPATTVVVEMIPESLGGVFARYKLAGKAGDRRRSRVNKNLAGLGNDLKWKKRGWGPFENYRPIFKVALLNGLNVLPGNLDRKTTMTLGRKGLSSIESGRIKQWSLDTPYSKPQAKLLTDMLFDSHCGFVPRKALAPMLLVQQARDGSMATAMLQAPQGANAVLIAGSGHIRRDVAVPRVLKRKQPGARVVSISFTEVTPDQQNPRDYEPPSADNGPVFDYLYFTPKSEIKDHCAELAKRFQKKKAAK
jgi:uncharacterized iron-regulated protein